MMKKATFDGSGQPLKIQDAPLPKVPPQGVLIRTTYSGVCHSDVLLRRDKIDYGDGVVMSPYKFIGEPYKQTVFGHEITGMIMAFGENADPGPQNLKVGDNVIVYPWTACEQCEVCKLGMGNKCSSKQPFTDMGTGPSKPGGYATHVPVSHCRHLIKVPDSIPPYVACMLPCSGATAYAAVLKTIPHIDQALKERGQANLLVIGAGGLGLWALKLAKKVVFADKNVKIFVSDISEDKFPGAIEAGADEGIVWERSGTVDDTIMKTINNGKRNMDAVIDFVGHAKTTGISMKCLNNGGILVVIGLGGGSLSVSLAPFLLSGIVLTGGKTSTFQELADLVDIVAKKGLKYPLLKFLPLECVNKALDELEAGTMQGRTVLKFD